MFQYRALGDALNIIISHKKQLKSVIYSDLLKGVNRAAAYSLLATITNNLEIVRETASTIIQKESVQINNINLMYIMIGQYINTGKIKGGGQLKQIIIRNKHILPKLNKHSKINKSVVQIRIRKVQQQQYNQLSHIFSPFKQDTIVPTMWHLSHQQYSKLMNSNPQLLCSAGVVIQSLSSALPALLLLKGLSKSNLYNFSIIDACAAPGNKTIQLSDLIIERRGIVHAIQKDKHRHQLLKANLVKYKVQNVQTLCWDFLQVMPEHCKRVKFVLLDPTCSGSGMLSNNQSTNDSDLSSKMSLEEYCEYKFDQLQARQQQRIQNLHIFQLNLLLHAANFGPLRICYSTCSVYSLENENVVQEFLEKCPNYIVKANGKVYNKNINIIRGFGEFGHNCIRIDPRTRQTDGFFICVFKKMS